MALDDRPRLADSDWRLQGQEKYLRGASLRWKAWSPYRDGGDHDHCEFCSAKFGSGNVGDQSEEEVLTSGFVTDDDYRWICRDCFRDFRQAFGWSLDVSHSDGGVEDFV